MNIQQFFAMSLGLSVENIYYIAIAVLACILGAEIAGICMLIGKVRRARKGEEETSNDEYNGGANYAIAALSFGAVSATAELALLVLAIACAVGAFVLCILLAVCHAKGYLLISAKDEKLAKEQPAAPVYAPVEYPEQVVQDENPVAEEPVAEEPVAEERPAVMNQAAGLDHNYDDDIEAQQAAENLIDTEEDPQEEPAEEITESVEEATEEVTEEPLAEELAGTTEMAVVAEAPNTNETQSVQTLERTVLSQGVPGYAGQAPVIEKHIIETTKEVYKEVNTTTVTTDAPASKPEEKPVPDELRKAIDELKQISIQFRLNSEVAVVNPAQANGDMDVPTVINMEEEDPDLIGRTEKDTEDETKDTDRINGEDGDVEKDIDGDNDYDYDYDDIFGSERIVGYDEETGCHILARYRKSCEAKLIQARPETKKYYSAIRNALMGYEGTKERMSWTVDTYTNDHTQIAKINVRSRSLDLYLALDPSTLEDSVYNGRDVGAKKKYAETPFLYKVNSPRKLTLALELVQRTCEEQGLSPIDIEEVRYEEQYPFTDTQTLITRGLVREYLREGRLAATFELDPDHVPQLIEEDQTVIPANANFTWEFDNDQPAIEEEPVVEEPIIEEEPVVEVVEEEPVVTEEPAVAAPVSGTTTTTTTHETIRTTERHYTERYYGTGATAQITEQTRTIEVLPEHTTAPIEAEAEEIAPEVTEEPIAQDQSIEDTAPQEVAEEITEEAPEETEETLEEPEEEIQETLEEETEEEITEVQSSVAALFGDDVNEDDEPIEEEPAYEDEPEAEAEEEPAYEDEPEAEAEEEPAYEEDSYTEAEEEPAYEEDTYAEAEEEPAYEEDTYAEAEEDPAYEDEPEEDSEQVYENFEENEFEDSYEEEESDADGDEEPEEEEIEEEVAETPASAPRQAPAPVTNSDVVRLDVCIFDDYFENGAVVNLETLKQVGLAPENATTLKLFATGSLNGEFIVEANHFTIDAIRAIGEAGGDSVMIR